MTAPDHVPKVHVQQNVFAVLPRIAFLNASGIAGTAGKDARAGTRAQVAALEHSAIGVLFLVLLFFFFFFFFFFVVVVVVVVVVQPYQRRQPPWCERRR